MLSVLVPMLLVVATRADQPAGTDVSGYLDAMVDSGVPGVAVVVIQGDKVLTATGHGSTGSGSADANTRFRVASLTKSFTATAVLQLVQKGSVDLDRPVASYLREFCTADDRSDRITVRQVLNQSSGLTDRTLGFNQYAARPTNAEEAVALLRDSRLAYDPETSWDYSNPNYWLAARLVEVVSGEAFSDYLARHIFTPLGMRRTSHYDVPGQAPAVAESHSYVFGHPLHLDDPDSFAGGAGGVVTTANDLGRWLRFQHGYSVLGQQGEVLSSTLLQEQHRRQSPLQEYSVGYALGWWNGEPADGGISRISHSGTGAGTSAYEGLFPGGIGIGVLINAGTPRADVVAADLYALVSGESLQDVATAPAPWPDVIAVVAVIAVGALGLRGIRNARKWAVKGNTAARWTIVALLLVVSACLVAVPWIGGRVVARQADWTVLFYTAPVPSAAVLIGAVCLLLLAAARSVALLRNRGMTGDYVLRP
ncbi:serine hydrolase [Aeromicrobium sp.]|uniref:serine hydrolase domain-containing protein n=1 Tax=Aeromicrobium sp. TaxID=1871063 RepID=UPI00199F27BD|nr:serine hydrolase domain-containing protein [Aeromicrobium sp.]MBC7631299.1 beta-lactamase family protein [Aeromicrobium sp.]